jgi:hypothetical protein
MTVIRNDVYACVVTTAPESLLQGTYSMMFSFLHSATAPWQWCHTNGQSTTMAKALLHPHMNKLGRTTFHKTVVEALDAVDPQLVEGAITAAIILDGAKQTPVMTDGRGVVTDFVLDPRVYEAIDKMPSDLMAAKYQAVLTPHNPALMCECVFGAEQPRPSA